MAPLEQQVKHVEGLNVSECNTIYRLIENILAACQILNTISTPQDIFSARSRI
ncbi:hypothetical protein FOPG_17356 [Fusarium oxysporum f. sp. conglutinans race 2 54008]|uniref:Uncharacterized protein n=1 Tax=Fusarium oxysporum f. sp. conglutinans race 2 54008 TaxID=1089457 RepID=X0GSX9_FUSOX|nr:hypothetical protein FOPG_17356 [Fusarium oxysporum f. sp. conglutinans race 2 54008]